MRVGNPKPPNSWPAFAWRVVRDPIAVITLLSVATVGYVGLRIAGYDVLPPVLSKFGVSTVPQQPTQTADQPGNKRTPAEETGPRRLDISGNWKYKCTVIGDQFYEWGGTVVIHQEGPYGIQWKLFGQRLWENKADESGNKVFRNLTTAYPWETNWGLVTPEPAVRFGYRITTAEGTIEGYAYGDIEGAAHRPERFLGKFYQLPPYKAVHGRMEFRRMANDADAKWE